MTLHETKEKQMHPMQTHSSISIAAVDPQGEDALGLLREAAIEARTLYPELFPPGAAMPDNKPTPERGIYLVCYIDEEPVACGALRPIDTATAEIRRMFVTSRARRNGIAKAILVELENRAAAFGYRSLRLETGVRQSAAMALYEQHGFRRIPPFGDYVSDPVSVCYEKHLAPAAAQDSSDRQP